MVGPLPLKKRFVAASLTWMVNVVNDGSYQHDELVYGVEHGLDVGLLQEVGGGLGTTHQFHFREARKKSFSFSGQSIKRGGGEKILEG